MTTNVHLGGFVDCNGYCCRCAILLKLIGARWLRNTDISIKRTLSTSFGNWLTYSA